MKYQFLSLLFTFVFFIPLDVYGEQIVPFGSSTHELPSHVHSIGDINTYLNQAPSLPDLEQSELVEELIEETSVDIENRSLIEMLSKTTIKRSRFAFGYSSRVYLGQWPLSYRSDETKINWQYQKINTNQLDNKNGFGAKHMSYDQREEMHVRGGIQNQVTASDQAKEMILLAVKDQVDFPVAYQSVYGKNTQTTTAHKVEKGEVGKLESYAAAVNEKGTLTYGDVYLELSGRDYDLVINNVTEQTVTSWIPIQDHVTFSFTTE